MQQNAVQLMNQGGLGHNADGRASPERKPPNPSQSQTDLRQEHQDKPLNGGNSTFQQIGSGLTSALDGLGVNEAADKIIKSRNKKNTDLANRSR